VFYCFVYVRELDGEDDRKGDVYTLYKLSQKVGTRVAMFKADLATVNKSEKLETTTR